MKIRVNDFILENPKINENIKIVLISDIHNNVTTFGSILLAIKKIRPNYVCVPGDILDKVNSDYNRLLTFLIEITKLSKLVISLGNHDVLEYKNLKWKKSEDFSFFEKLSRLNNCVVLKDDFSTYKDKIDFFAINYPDDWYKKENSNILKNNKFKIDDEKFNILLSHSPNALTCKDGLLLDDTIKQFNLIFSGHNHGGLVPHNLRKLFKNRGIVGPYFKLFMQNSFGNWTVDHTSLIISDGITKISKSSSLGFVSNTLNSFYIPDIENILLKHGDDHKIVLHENSIINI